MIATQPLVVGEQANLDSAAVDAVIQVEKHQKQPQRWIGTAKHTYCTRKPRIASYWRCSSPQHTAMCSLQVRFIMLLHLGDGVGANPYNNSVLPPNTQVAMLLGVHLNNPLLSSPTALCLQPSPLHPRMSATHTRALVCHCNNRRVAKLPSTIYCCTSCTHTTLAHTVVHNNTHPLGITVCDLGSSNGTWLLQGGVYNKLQPHTDYPLVLGSVLRIADVTMVVCQGLAEDARQVCV